MSVVRVRAVKPVVFANLRRYREGEIFEMAADHYYVKNKKTGKPLLDSDGQQRVCQSVELVEGFELNAESGKVEAKVKKTAAKAKE